MEIRKLAIKDYDVMVRLWARAGLPFKPKGRDSRAAIAGEIKANPDFFLGAFEGNCLAGIVVLSCDMRKGWINRLAVDPEWRRRGVAKLLVEESESVLRKRGLGLFCALIEESNQASRRLFEKCGFVEHDDIKYFSKRDSEDV